MAHTPTNPPHPQPNPRPLSIPLPLTLHPPPRILHHQCEKKRKILSSFQDLGNPSWLVKKSLQGCCEKPFSNSPRIAFQANETPSSKPIVRNALNTQNLPPKKNPQVYEAPKYRVHETPPMSKPHATSKVCMRHLELHTRYTPSKPSAKSAFKKRHPYHSRTPDGIRKRNTCQVRETPANFMKRLRLYQAHETHPKTPRKLYQGPGNDFHVGKTPSTT